MSAVEAESIALAECLAACDRGQPDRAAVWLRLANEALHAQLAGEQLEMFP
ncbi:hypothetical protein LQ772_08110 [Frateuria edaphi]|uniref:hypothetical protein n=1 Tax=Frateuria edaphi TaxID=2898793 RepID=UPI001E3884F9|nr:hypothetical protein [Frateuria edaphi]UGB47233.1 hypothetical protein LQ772_08110 [Frateuria edaphi]